MAMLMKKFPYLYLNCIEAMPEKEIVIIVDGGGVKAGAITWLQETVKSKKYTSDSNNDKTINKEFCSYYLEYNDYNQIIERHVDSWAGYSAVY
mgnify:CR=1 FL=1